jgi:hypothetical protein
MKQIYKVLLFTVGVLAIALEEISKAIDEASQSLEDRQPMFPNRLPE